MVRLPPAGGVDELLGLSQALKTRARIRAAARKSPAVPAPRFPVFFRG
jgi:hypothetical protein